MIKKYSLILAALLCTFFYGLGQTPWINEIHYDNTGTDASEGVEIAGIAGTNLSDYRLIPYNGNGGTTYSEPSLSGIIPDDGSGYGAVFVAVSGLQNGSPDGIVLCEKSPETVLQFLSYEGSFTATNGPANGLISIDIGVSEGSGNALGESLQLVGTGCEYSSFSWTPLTTSTYGSLNTGQTISCDNVDWGNLQSPPNGTIDLGSTFNVYARAWEDGVTNSPGQGPGLLGWIGYSSSNTDPSGGGWTWVAASYNTDDGNNDEFVADIGAAISNTGSYYYASRFQLNGGPFRYGGYNAGFWDGSTNVNGVLTVTDSVGSSCLEDGFDSVDGWVTHAGGNWTEVADNGTYTGNGVYVNAGDAVAENKLGFNTQDDWFELPPIDNPLLFTYWGRLLGSPSGTNRMKVQVYSSGIWNDIVEHTSTLTTYVQYSANLSAYSAETGVRIRLYRSEHDESFFVDDIEVICVDCTPSHSITDFSPALGPENTYVTITGTGFTASTTVSFNGGLATIDSQTATELVVLVPTGVSTGVITVTEAFCDVYSSSDFTIITGEENSCEGAVTATDLFISEVTDATYGAMTYIEIYNGTGSSVDLSNYELEITFNGNSNNTSIASLTGNLAHGDIHVVSTSTSGYTCSVPGGDTSYADQVMGSFSGIDSAKNDSDCITLYNSSTPIDVWGDCSDKNWSENMGVAIGNEGFNFRRLTAASFPSTLFALADWNIIDWADGSSNSTCSENDYSDVGNYASGFPPTISADPIAPTGCDLTAILTVTAAEGYSGGNSLVYQWYYHTPGDPGWTIITNGGLYSGANTDTLNILNVLNTIDYQYYCQVRENDANCYRASDAARIEVDRTIWTTSWSDGAPDINTIAVIDGLYQTDVNGNFDACSLVINSGANRTLDVKNSTYVRVVNNVINNGTLIVQTHGAFVQDGNGVAAGTFTNSGTSRVIKETELLNNWYEYTYWSSPVIGETIDDAFPNTPTSRRFWFDASNYLDQFAESLNDNDLEVGQDDIDDNGDDWTVAPGSLLMAEGVGYAATSSPAGLFPGSDQATFEGVFHTGDLTVPIVINGFGLDNDWNLIGNPYASAIDFDDVYAANSTLITGAAFLWSHASPPDAENNGNENWNFNQNDYAIITVGSGNTAGGSGVIPASGNFISSGQGFFVVGIANGNLTFKNSMRRADTSSNDQFFDAYDQGENLIDLTNRLWLNLTSDNGVFNQLLVAYVNGATNGNDGMAYDATRNLSSGVSAIIYTFIEDDPDEKKYAIQGLDVLSLNLNETIPVGFKTSIEEFTVYKFSVPQFEGGFLGSNPVFLKDTFQNITHNLSESDYSFTSQTGEFNDRFEIVFQEDTLGVNENQLNPNDLLIVELSNGDVIIKVNSEYQMETIKISDLLGRTLYVLNGEGNSQKTFNLSNLSQATYLATVTLTDGQQVTKKAIKQK